MPGGVIEGHLTRVKASNELQKRILATLIVNGGSIESTGQATSRLHALLAVRPPKRQQTAAAVISLEKRGFVVRDNRIVGNIKPRSIGGRREVQPKGCFGIYLAKEADELYAGIPDLPDYVQELRDVIQQRMIGAAARVKQTGVKREQVVTPTPPVLPTEPETDPKLVSALSQWDPAAIADALLDRVIERAKGVDSPDLLATIQQRNETIKRLEHEVASWTETSQAELTKTVRLERNLSEMTKRVNVLADENEKLKAQARSFRERGGKLSAEIRDILAPSDRLGLERLLKERKP